MRQISLMVVLSCSMVIYGVGAISHAVLAAAGDPAKGKAIYQAKCMTCHGAQGKGDGPLGKKLKPPAADFSSAESKKKSPEELHKIIENGVPKTSMVAWNKQLNESEIENVLAYVLSLRK